MNSHHTTNNRVHDTNNNIHDTDDRVQDTGDTLYNNEEAAAPEQNGSLGSAAEAENAATPKAPLLGNTALLGQYFRLLFDTENWGENLGERPPYRSGPVAKEEGSLSKRRLADPEARFYYSVMMAEIMVLPLCVATDAPTRDQFNREIAGILGLDVAVKRGWIKSYTICWRGSKFPRMPYQIRIHSLTGGTAKSKALGELEPHIRRFVSFHRDPYHTRG